MSTLLAEPPLLATNARAGSTGLATALQFVALTYGLSWTIWIGGWLLAGRPADLRAPGMTAAVYLGSFGPGLAATILSARAGTLRAWLSAFVRVRAGWRAYAVALLPLPLVVVGLTWALGYTPRPSLAHPMPPVAYWLTLFPVSIFNGVATVVLGAGPLGEEGGWRGFLLPRLLGRLDEVRASAVLGVIWALWHLPVMVLFAGWRDGLPLGFYLPAYTAGVIGLAYVLTRVWRLGRGSLVPCIWLHGLVNAIGGVAFDRQVWASGWSAQASTAHLLLAFWIVAGGLWVLARRAGACRGV